MQYQPSLQAVARVCGLAIVAIQVQVFVSIGVCRRVVDFFYKIKEKE